MRRSACAIGASGGVGLVAPQGGWYAKGAVGRRTPPLEEAAGLAPLQRAVVAVVPKMVPFPAWPR